jgi:hypothetical protein
LINGGRQIVCRSGDDVDLAFEGLLLYAAGPGRLSIDRRGN